MCDEGVNHGTSSPALRAPSPPLRAEERDGERRFMEIMIKIRIKIMNALSFVGSETMGQAGRLAYFIKA